MSSYPVAIGPFESLAALGFQRDGQRFRRDTLTVQKVRGWWLLGDESVAMAGAGGSSLGRPGLWKPRMDDTGLRVFEIPDSVVEPLYGDAAWDDDRDPCVAALDRVIRWAQATAAGKLSDGWQPPAAEELASWAPPNSLSVRCDTFARQATLVREPSRLAIELALTGEVSAELSARRNAWLDRVLQAAERRWRMVRVERASHGEDGRWWPQVAVDLSGAPAEICEGLVRAALAAVQAVGRQLLPTVTLLCDPSVACAAWEIDPHELSSNP